MTPEVPESNGIEYIDLRKDKIAEPADAYRVHEGQFGIAKFSPERPYLVTEGLSSCKALALYRPDTKEGLIAHIALVTDLEKLIQELVKQFKGDLKGVQASVVMGALQDQSEAGKWYGTWPTIDELVKEIKKFSPASLQVDANEGGKDRGISLDLATGELKEIDRETNTPWDHHDTSINRDLEQLVQEPAPRIFPVVPHANKQ